MGTGRLSAISAQAALGAMHQLPAVRRHGRQCLTFSRGRWPIGFSVRMTLRTDAAGVAADHALYTLAEALESTRFVASKPERGTPAEAPLACRRGRHRPIRPHDDQQERAC